MAKKLDIKALSDACSALSCEPRAAIMAHLARNGPTSVNAIQEAVGISTSGVSQHLNKLKQYGAVTSRRESQTVYYDVMPLWVTSLMAQLEQISMVTPAKSKAKPKKQEPAPIPIVAKSAEPAKAENPAKKPAKPRKVKPVTEEVAVAVSEDVPVEILDDGTVVDPYVDPEAVYPEESAAFEAGE